MARTQKNTQPLTTAQRLSSIVKSCRDIMRKDKGLNGDLDRLPMLTWIMFLKFLDDMEQIAEQETKMSGKRFRPALEAPYRWRDWAAKADGITGDELIAFVNNEEAVRSDGKKGPGLFAYLRGLQGANGGDRRDVIATVFKGTINRMINGYLLRDVINKVSDIHFTSSDEIHTLGHLYESMLKEMRDAAGDSGEFYTPRAVVRFIVEVMNPRLGEVILDPACGTGGFLVESFKHLEKQCKTVEDRRMLQTQSIIGGEAKSLPYLLAQMNLVLHGLESPKIDPLNSLRFPLREIGDRDRVDIIMTNPPFGDGFTEYKRCRVQLHAQGIVLRDAIPGAEIKTKKQQVCKAGDFLVAEIDAKVGGFGIVPDDLDGAIVSSHYFLFDVNEEQL